MASDSAAARSSGWAGEGEAQEAQLPLLQFALRLLKLFDRHKHRHAHFILELRNNRYECC